MLQTFYALRYLQTLEVVWEYSTLKLKLLYKSFPRKNLCELIFTDWRKNKANFIKVKSFDMLLKPKMFYKHKNANCC